MNLGAFGGYVVFKFANSVENDPDNPFGIDFTIFGNPLPDWAEPAIVLVMKDENNNNLPDDNWYELAGSDYFFSSTIKNYTVTYTNPYQPVATDIFWTDNQDNSGYIYANNFYTQPYYPLSDSFPHLPNDFLVCNGTKIQANLNLSTPGQLKSYKRAFGYADNQFRGSEPYTVPDNPYTQIVENSGGDAFDISWAINADGNYVFLDEIDFIKVQNAVMANTGVLGEISPEITGAVDVAPNSSMVGIDDLIVIKDLPQTISSDSFLLEVFYFKNGLKVDEFSITWECSMDDAEINENNVLILNSSGQLELTAFLTDNNSVQTTVTSTVNFSLNIHEQNTQNYIISPNPATENFIINNTQNVELKIFDIQGNMLLKIDNYSQNQLIDVSSFEKGIYFISILKNNIKSMQKIVIY